MPLFKYCGASGLLVLKNREIKVTPPNEFNDPFEFSPVVRTADPKGHAERQVQNVIDDPRFFNDHRVDFAQISTFAEFQSFVGQNRAKFTRILEDSTSTLDAGLDVLNTLSQQFGVICLTGDPLQPLMWAHYADSHKGMVIEFDANVSLFNYPAFLQVDYCADRVVYDASGGTSRDVVEQFARRKSPHWSYEQESRLILDLAQTRKVAGTPPMYLLRFDPRLLKSVTLGLRSSSALRAEVEMLTSAPPLQHLEVFQIVADPNEFKLDRKKIK